MAERWLMVSWIAAHTRSERLAEQLNIESLFLTGGPRRYLANARATWRALARRRPVGVIVMQPPPFALFVVRLYAAIHRTRVAGDLHTGVFLDPKWRWSTRTVLRLLRDPHYAIVTNEPLRRLCDQQGVRAFVVDDPAPDLTNEIPRQASEQRDRYVIVPLAYAHDEPIDQILGAARLLPDERFVLTGRAPVAVRDAAPANVEFTGYLATSEYRALFAQAAAVLALTTDENTMQCAGYEAMSYGRPLVTSPTRVLRAYFGHAATYAAPQADAIARAVCAVLAESEHYRRTMAERARLQRARNRRQVDRLKSWIESADDAHNSGTLP